MGKQMKRLSLFVLMMALMPATLQADMAPKALTVGQISEQVVVDFDRVQSNHEYVGNAQQSSVTAACIRLNDIAYRIERLNAAAAMLLRTRGNTNKDLREALRLQAEIAVAADLFSMDTREASTNVRRRLNRIRAQAFMESTLSQQMQQARDLSQQDFMNLGQMFPGCRVMAGR